MSRPPSSAAFQLAFTLIELLIALMIFIVISAAMLGVWNASATVYRAGEGGRQAHERLMTLTARFQDDAAAAVPSAAGGHVFAWVSPDAGGNCVFGWTIRRRITREHRGQLAFVLWGVDGDNLLRRELELNSDLIPTQDNNGVLLRADSDARSFLLQQPSDPTLSDPPRVIAKEVLHCSAWLMGATYFDGTKRQTYIRPARNIEAKGIAASTWWLWSIVDDGSPQPTEPNPERDNDNNRAYATWDEPSLWGGSAPRYPDSIRIALVLAQDVGSQGALVSLDEQSLRVRGVRLADVTAGTLLRLGSNNNMEWIGVHGPPNGEALPINTDASHGPLNIDESGRGIFRSRVRDTWTAGTPVRSGQLRTLVVNFQ